MSDELRGRGTDLPAETGTGADRDITPVPEHAGRNVGITRAEAHARHHAAHGDHQGTAGSTADASDQTEGTSTRNDNGRAGNDNAALGSTGTGKNGSTPPGSQETGAGARTPAHDAGRPAGTSPRDVGDGSAAEAGSGGGGYEGESLCPGTPTQGTDGANGSGNRRPGPPGNMETAWPGPAAPSTGVDSPRSHAADTTAPARGKQAGNTDTEAADSPSPGRSWGSQDTGTAVPRDQNGEDPQRRARAGADAAQPALRGEGTAGAKTTEDKGRETQEQEQKDQPSEQKPPSDASPGMAHEVGPEHSPDQSADEQRWAAMEQRMHAAMEQRMQAAVDGIKDDYEAKLDELKAEHKAESDSIRAEYEADKAQLRREIGELKEGLQSAHPGRQPAPEGSRAADEQPVRPGTPDGSKPGERNDVPRTGGDAGGPGPGSGVERADIAGRAGAGSGKEGRKTPERSDRVGVFGAENVGAAGAGIAFGQSVAELLGKVPPEVGVGASAVGFIAASMATPVVKRVIEKWKGRDEH